MEVYNIYVILLSHPDFTATVINEYHTSYSPAPSTHGISTLLVKLLDILHVHSKPRCIIEDETIILTYSHTNRLTFSEISNAHFTALHSELIIRA